MFLASLGRLALFFPKFLKSIGANLRCLPLELMSSVKLVLLIMYGVYRASHSLSLFGKRLQKRTIVAA